MKRKSLVLLATVAVLFITNGVRAEESEIEPTGKFGESVKALRERNQEERKALLEKNKGLREDEREENKASREALRKENKAEMEKFKSDTKNLLISKTPEERKLLRPTIQAERKALIDQNRTERQALQKTMWDSKKSVTENIRTSVDTFRSTVRARWEALWASFGKK